MLTRLTISGVVIALVALLIDFQIGLFLEDKKARTGFDAQDLVTLRVRLSAGQAGDAQARARVLKVIEERVASLPRTRGFCAASHLPIVDVPAAVAFETQSALAGGLRSHKAVRSAVSAGYFTQMRIALTAGRDFSDADDASQPPVAVVDEGFAREAWPGEDPVGKRIRIAASTVLSEVVGMVRPVPQSLSGPGLPQIYVPLLQDSFAELRLGVRTEGPLEDEGRVAAALDDLVSVAEVAPMDRYIADALVVPRRLKTANQGLMVAGLILTLATIVTRGLRARRKSDKGLPTTALCPNCGHSFVPPRVTLATQAVVARYGPNPTQCVKCNFIWSR